MKHEDKSAIDAFEEIWSGIDLHFYTSNELSQLNEKGMKIRHTLRIADKLMQEPSDGMVRATFLVTDYCGTDYSENDAYKAWRAMRDQMLKEIE